MDDKSRVPIPRSVLYSVVLSYICSIAITAGALVYMRHVDNESNSQWCSLVVTLDDTYTQNPPASEVGRKIAQSMHNLRSNFKC